LTDRRNQIEVCCWAWRRLASDRWIYLAEGVGVTLAWPGAESRIEGGKLVERPAENAV